MKNPASEGMAETLTEAMNEILTALGKAMGRTEASFRLSEIRMWMIVTDGTEQARAPVNQADICPGAMLLLDTDLRIGPNDDTALLIQMQSKVYVDDQRVPIHKSTEVTEMEIMPEDVEGDGVKEKFLDDLMEGAKIFPELEVALLRIRLSRSQDGGSGSPKEP